MPLTDQRFSIIDIPAVQPNVLASYDNCPVDEYMGNGTRYKRFSQYRMSFTESAGWGFELLPHRDYTTFKKFNNVAGGIRRGYLPIEVDFTPLIRAGAEGSPLTPRTNGRSTSIRTAPGPPVRSPAR